MEYQYSVSLPLPIGVAIYKRLHFNIAFKDISKTETWPKEEERKNVLEK